MYLGKPLTVAGEPDSYVKEIIETYSDLLDKIVKADSHVAVYRYEYDVRSMVLSSKKQNISYYYFDFKTCTVYTDAQVPRPGNQLSFILHKPVLLECHSQFTSYPYTFASYSYTCKISQPYVAAIVRMHSDAVLCLICALLIKTVIKNNCQ